MEGQHSSLSLGVEIVTRPTGNSSTFQTVMSCCHNVGGKLNLSEKMLLMCIAFLCRGIQLLEGRKNGFVVIAQDS